jgi:hypothetical protein
MTKKRTPARMQQLVARWRVSGESGARFARRHGIPVWTFWYWCRKLVTGIPTPSTAGEPSFVPVHVAGGADGSVVEITLADGTRMQVRAGAPTELVRTIVAALRPPC